MWTGCDSGFLTVGLSGRLLQGSYLCFCILSLATFDLILSGCGFSDILEYISSMDQRKGSIRTGRCHLSVDHPDILDDIKRFH